LAPAIQPLECQLAYGLSKLREGTTVVADAKVIEVASHLASQCLPEVGELADIACLAQPFLDGLEGTPQALL
jgi:hypothetical protein